jgi:hypothetical protein
VTDNTSPSSACWHISTGNRRPRIENLELEVDFLRKGGLELENEDGDEFPSRVKPDRLKFAPGTDAALRALRWLDSKADQYQRKADEAEEHARTSTDAAAQAAWREAAQVWRESRQRDG